MLFVCNEYDFKNEVLNFSGTVFVNFWASWNENCKTMKYLMRDIDSDGGNTPKIVEVDWDRNRKLAEKYHVPGVPSLLIFNDGSLVTRYSGVISKKVLDI